MSRSGADGGTKFIILCAARTGSTMLRQLLDSHPEVCCYGEIMAAAVTPDRWDSEAPMRRKLLEQYRQGPRQFLRELGQYPPECKAVGFKIKYEELVLADYAWLLEWLKDHREIRVIHHRRENRLKRLISVITATQVHGVFNVRSERDLPAAAKVRLTVGECLDDFARTEGREIAFREYFRDHAMLETTYEAVVGNHDGVRERMADFLGVAPARLTTPTLKINPDDVREVLENVRGARRSLSGHGVRLVPRPRIARSLRTRPDQAQHRLRRHRPDQGDRATAHPAQVGALTRYPPVPLSVTVTRPVTGSFDGIGRVAFFAPKLVGLNLSPTVHVCVGASVTPEHRSWLATCLNWSGFAPASAIVPRIRVAVPSLRTVTLCRRGHAAHRHGAERQRQGAHEDHGCSSVAAGPAQRHRDEARDRSRSTGSAGWRSARRRSSA